MDSIAARLLDMEPNRTGTTLRRLREERALSLGDVASLLFSARSWLSNVEAGRRWPKDRGWAERADLALRGRGQLVDAWDADQRDRARLADTVRMLEQARRESEQLLAEPDTAALDEIGQHVIDLATNARFEPYDRTLHSALALRSELMRRIRAGAHTPATTRDLHVALGRVCGVLAYLTLDLGQADTAHVHAEAAFRLGDRADDNSLRVWARGTQALAHRFVRDFTAARDAATDGLNYVDGSTGTGEARLLCGLAASVANLGDERRALSLLDAADRARDDAGPDALPGLFTFTAAKQMYYRGFSLMWAEDPALLSNSIAASKQAIDAWQAQRSPGDEMLSQIYLSTAHARLGDLDNCIAEVAPVMETPVTGHFSWVRKQINQLDVLLGEYFPDSRTAADMRETLQAYVYAPA